MERIFLLGTLFHALFLGLLVQVQSGCVDLGKCCEGKNYSCFHYGERLDGKGGDNDKCYCDEKCFRLSDCCKDVHQVCHAQDCITSDFGPWGNCSVQCGFGEMRRARKILQEPRYGGKKCPDVLVKEKICYSKRTCRRGRGAEDKIAFQTARIMQHSFSQARSSKSFDPLKSFNKNLFLRYHINSTIQEKSYCAIFKMETTRRTCHVPGLQPLRFQEEERTVCVECQKQAMKHSLGYRCHGQGVVGTNTLWKTVGHNECRGTWTLQKVEQNCECGKKGFIFI